MDGDLVIPQTKGKRAKPGRPRKMASAGSRGGRPRKYEKDEDVQPRPRLRAPKVPINPGTSDRSTRLSTGNLELPNYTLRKSREQRRREGDDDVQEVMPPRMRPGRPRRVVESDDDDDLQEAPQQHKMLVYRPKKPASPVGQVVRAKKRTRVSGNSSDPGDVDPFSPSGESSVRSPSKKRARKDVERSRSQAIHDDHDDYDEDAYDGQGLSGDPAGFDDMYNASPPAASPNSGRIARNEAQSSMIVGPTASPATLQQAGKAMEQSGMSKRATRLSREVVAELLQRGPIKLIPTREYLTGVRALYWSENNETEFQELWGKTYPSGRLDFGRDNGASEMSLWRTMLICFNATPMQLFTYGLKPHDSAYVSWTSLLLDGRFCQSLERICTHPIWNKDLSKLRYVLQATIAADIRNHVEPIGPVPKELFDLVAPHAGVDTLDKKGKLQYSLFLDSNHKCDPAIKSVIRVLEHAGKWADAEEPEDALFILDAQHLERVTEVLNKAWSPDYLEVVPSVEEYHWQFQNIHGEVLGKLRPQAAWELRSFVRHCELSTLRDEEIRRAIREAKIPGEFLFDGPNFGQQADIIPLYEYHPDLDTRAAVLLRGDYSSNKRRRLELYNKANRGEKMAAFSATVRRLGEAAVELPAPSSTAEMSQSKPSTTTAQTGVATLTPSAPALPNMAAKESPWVKTPKMILAKPSKLYDALVRGVRLDYVNGLERHVWCDTVPNDQRMPKLPWTKPGGYAP
ncbi:hypothetical protein F5Y13DRAFT_38305 [Hypoxylon sp. FL1857]|nr:hypothetical protein F5Y13DRAFT_38305 [Hypoxylon sp. FL1857]